MSKLASPRSLARRIGAASFVLWFVISWPLAHAQETCERTGIEFGFFNGVQTQERLAQRAVATFLPSQYGRTTPDGQPISYTLYYNDSQAGISDFIETFEQRLQEQDGLLAGRFELFFSAMNGGGSWWSRITEAVPALSGLLGGLFDTFRSYLIRDMTADFGNPNTAVVSQRHREQIDHALTMDKGLLLFAHSQGNLFVNRAYDHARGKVGADSVRVVHVAPASPRATGPHTLANLDIVINLLRTAGTVLPITDSIPGFLTRATQPDLSGQLDPLGHGLLETYLNRNFEPSARIRRHVEQALGELASSRPTRLGTNGIRPLPFEYLPWRGGPQPDPVYTTTPPTHRLDQVRYRGDFVCNVSGGRNRNLWCQRSPDSRSWTVELTGLNVNGSRTYTFRNRWGTAESPWDWMVTYINFPLRYRSPKERPGFHPVEAQGWEEMPVGTTMRFSTLTYNLQGFSSLGGETLYWCNRWAPCGSQLGFINGHLDPWRSPDRITTRFETYQGGSSTLVNQAARDDWRQRFEEHRSDNDVRRLDYLDRLRTYEERQRQLRACTATVAPQPPPVDPNVPVSPGTPELPECTAEDFANQDTTSCRVPS